MYLDESGDLGFDFVNKKPSKFFTVCILVVKSPEGRKRIAKMVERTLRRKLNPKGKRKRLIQELKATSTTLKIKEYFYRNIRKVDFAVYSLTLNKRRVYQNLVQDKARVYNWVTRMLLDQIDFSTADTHIHLVIDRSKSKPEISEFDSYILLNLRGKIDPKIPLTISHRDSQEDLCLNAVDLFSWGVYRKYEKADRVWYDVFKEKIRYDDLYLK